MKTIYVSKTPSSFHFNTLQEAILSIPDATDEHFRILVSPGIYEEKVFIRKKNLEIIGESPDNTIFRYGDGARKLLPEGTGEYGTFNTAVMLITGCDITLRNLTVENTAGPGYLAGQALSVFVGADRCRLFNCRLLGFQDTVFAGNMTDRALERLMLPDFYRGSSVPILYPCVRNYFQDCYIEGDVDYIFGPNIAYFYRCEIHSKKAISEGQFSYITAANTPAAQEFGFVFNACRLTGESKTPETYLGRPWRDFAKTAFVHCDMDGHILPEGWHNWGKARAEAVCSYVEYQNVGPGAASSQRVPFSKVLNHPDLESYYSIQNVLSGNDGWEPHTFTTL